VSVSFGKLEAILERIPPHPEHLVSVLQEVQAEFNYVPAEALEAVCDHLGVPRSRGWEVATFYKAFSLEPKGEHEISVCMGTACHVRGAANVYEKFRRNLGLQGEEGTTGDLKFTLNKVRCIGCCSMGPVAKVDEEIHGDLDQRKAGALVKTFSKGQP
jgi:NADH-quinone oxidoreductase subunit E